MDISNAAPVITRDEILVAAPIDTIWSIQTDVDRWPAWQPDVESAKADGPLGVGSVFHWRTAGLDITSTVEEVEPPRRIAWAGPAPGIVAVHVWTLAVEDQGVLVRTEESWEGPAVDAQVDALHERLTSRCATGCKTSSAQPRIKRCLSRISHGLPAVALSSLVVEIPRAANAALAAI